MCWRSSAEYDLYRRTSARPGRSLFGWLRDLFRPRRPQVEEAEVVPFPAVAAARADQEPTAGAPKRPDPRHGCCRSRAARRISSLGGSRRG